MGWATAGGRVQLRQAAGLWRPRTLHPPRPADSKQSLAAAGCLPADYNPVYGRAIEGPVYAGIGPRTALTLLSSASEPDEAGWGKTIEIGATLVISGLREGARYKVGWLGGRVAAAGA